MWNCPTEIDEILGWYCFDKVTVPGGSSLRSFCSSQPILNVGEGITGELDSDNILLSTRFVPFASWILCRFTEFAQRSQRPHLRQQLRPGSWHGQGDPKKVWLGEYGKTFEKEHRSFLTEHFPQREHKLAMSSQKTCAKWLQ